MYVIIQREIYKKQMEEKMKDKMGNIFDYILWRDIPIEKVEFNEIDSLILTRFSYFPLDGLCKSLSLFLLRLFLKMKK